MKECRFKHTRDYFERGCLCILSGELDKVSHEKSDRFAAKYYEKNCSCSRNYPNDHNGGVS